MYRNIIVGFDGSPHAEDAVALGKLLADVCGAALVLAEVFYFSPSFGEQDPILHELEAAHTPRLKEVAGSVGARAEGVASTSPARGLHQLAEDDKADLIVVGSAHHGSVGRVLAGSVGVKLLHGAPCPVAIAPRGYAERAPYSVEEVIVGFDGSAEAQEALDAGIDLARSGGARLKVAAVAERPSSGGWKSAGRTQGWHELEQEIERILRDRLDKALPTVPEDVRVETMMATGDPAITLAEIASRNGGVLVVGSRGYGPLRRVFAGSVSTALTRSARCPLIVHPRPAGPKARAATADQRRAERVG